jgi:hypothetical protein
MNVRDVFFYIGFSGAFLGLVIMVGLFISQKFRKFERIPEKDGVRIFRCGGKFDYISLTFPFVKVGISRDFIAIKYSQTEITIDIDNIKEIKMVNGVTAMGIKIIHSREDIPKEVILWTPYAHQLSMMIQKNNS